MSITPQMMDLGRKRRAARCVLLHVIHNHRMPRDFRGYLRRRVIEYDLCDHGYTFVGLITAMLMDQNGWSVEYVGFMWYILNMAYFGLINQHMYEKILHVCYELEKQYGTELRDYFVHGNPSYPAGNLVSLRHGVLAVFAKWDSDAYYRLVEGIESFDGLHRVLCRFDPNEYTGF